VEVDKAVVLLHELVQGGHQVAQEAHVIQLLVARQLACRHHNHLQFKIQTYSKLHSRMLMNSAIVIKIVALIRKTFYLNGNEQWIFCTRSNNVLILINFAFCMKISKGSSISKLFRCQITAEKKFGEKFLTA
jgi:hypothetical protein